MYNSINAKSFFLNGKKDFILCSFGSGDLKKPASCDTFDRFLDYGLIRDHILVVNYNICRIEHKYRHKVLEASDRIHLSIT